jgi:hypothetical protein
MRFNEILEGTRADIAVKVFGDDYAEIERIAAEAREILEQVPGAADVEFDALGKAPMLEIKLKRDAMTRYNVHASEVNATVATALAGHADRRDRGRQPPLPHRRPPPGEPPAPPLTNSSTCPCARPTRKASSRWVRSPISSSPKRSTPSPASSASAAPPSW